MSGRRRDPYSLDGASAMSFISPSDQEPSSASRRAFVIGGAVAAASALAGRAGIGIVPPRRELPQTPLSPDTALARLVDGNRRYVDKRLTSFDDDLAMLRAQTVEKQEPFASVLSCADSRVPVELVFDQSIGRLFVTRVAGNIASAEIIASLEYGVAVLGTAVIVVMGHGSCGAVKSAMSGKAVPGQISTLYRYIRPALDEAGADLDAAVKANARIQAKLLRESSPVIAEGIAQRTLRVVAAYYGLSSGVVTMLE